MDLNIAILAMVDNSNATMQVMHVPITTAATLINNQVSYIVTWDDAIIFFLNGKGEGYYPKMHPTQHAWVLSCFDTFTHF